MINVVRMHDPIEAGASQRRSRSETRTQGYGVGLAPVKNQIPLTVQTPERSSGVVLNIRQDLARTCRKRTHSLEGCSVGDAK
jgi:hypothetical protein